MTLRFPKVHIDSKQQVFISFYINEKRYRLYNGKRIGSSTDPNSYPIEQRQSIGKVLASEIYSYLLQGGVLTNYRSTEVVSGKLSDLDYLKRALEIKLKEGYSEKYKSMLIFSFNSIQAVIKNAVVDREAISKVLNKYPSGTSHNTLKRHLNVLINGAISLGMCGNPMKDISSRKAKAVLHKPFENIEIILEDIKSFNKNLHLCCLLTYGCLLRPHREVRELTWGDFSKELDYINLSGSRNKSGRNRIVPVPKFIKEHLIKGVSEVNIFTGTPISTNADYFKTLWSRYKKQSKILAEGQTLYSFRHSGAIEVYKRTGSLKKLQLVMGHSNLIVSMTYLRGLEVSELKVDDMPAFN
jgi:integrase